MKRKQNSGMWDYLKSVGALDSGDKNVIDLAKKQWRKIYDTRYKAERRKRICQHVVSLQPKENERIKQGAKEYNVSIAEFLKKASLAYIEQVYMVDVTKIRKIEALLIRSLSALEEIGRRENRKGWFARENTLDEAKGIITNMKAEIHKELTAPDSLMTAIKNNPVKWPEILNLINDLKDTRS